MPATAATKASGVKKSSRVKHGSAGFKSKSKTKDPACSKAMSQWKSKDGGGLTKEISKVLGMCRAKAHALRKGVMFRHAGQEAKAQTLEHRVATGKVGVRHRAELARAKIKERQEKRAQISKGHGPTLREQADARRAEGGIVRKTELSIVREMRSRFKGDNLSIKEAHNIRGNRDIAKSAIESLTKRGIVKSTKGYLTIKPGSGSKPTVKAKVVTSKPVETTSPSAARTDRIVRLGYHPEAVANVSDQRSMDAARLRQKRSFTTAFKSGDSIVTDMRTGAKKTLDELKAHSKAKLGKKFHSVRLAHYKGGGSQVEVMSIHDGYHGRTTKIASTHSIESAPKVTTDKYAKSEISKPVETTASKVTGSGHKALHEHITKHQESGHIKKGNEAHTQADRDVAAHATNLAAKHGRKAPSTNDYNMAISHHMTSLDTKHGASTSSTAKAKADKSKPVETKTKQVPVKSAKVTTKHATVKDPVKEASDKLMSHIKEHGPKDMRDLRHELGYTKHDPMNPLKNPLHAAAKDLSERGIIKATHSVMGGSMTVGLPSHYASPASKPAAAKSQPSTHKSTPVDHKDLREFATHVQSAADAHIPAGHAGRFGGGKVFISHAHTAYNKHAKTHGHEQMTLPAFKESLVRANSGGHLTLSRADMVESMNPTSVRMSETKHPMGSTFNFVRTKNETKHSIPPMRTRTVEASQKRVAERSQKAQQKYGRHNPKHMRVAKHVNQSISAGRAVEHGQPGIFSYLRMKRLAAERRA